MNAQAKLDQQFELLVQRARAPLQTEALSTSASAEASWPPEHAPPQTVEPVHIVPSPSIQPGSSDIIPAAGKKAVVVRVSNGLSALDFAQPDRWVDVILTRQVEINSIFNDVIVQNARILAVDPDADDGDRSAARSVTLEVDMVGAQKLLLASQVGFLSLILRRPGDDPTPDVRQIDIGDLTTAAGTAEPQPETTASIASTASVAPVAPPPMPPASDASIPATAIPTAPIPAVPVVTPPVATTPTAAMPVATAQVAAPVAAPSVAADQTTDPAHEHDDPRFGWVTIKRPGAEPTLHKVRKEP